MKIALHFGSCMDPPESITSFNFRLSSSGREPVHHSQPPHFSCPFLLFLFFSVILNPFSHLSSFLYSLRLSFSPSSVGTPFTCFHISFLNLPTSVERDFFLFRLFVDTLLTRLCPSLKAFFRHFCVYHTFNQLHISESDFRSPSFFVCWSVDLPSSIIIQVSIAYLLNKHPKMTMSKSFTKIKRGLSVRSSALFETERSTTAKAYRPTISLPLERPDYVEVTPLSIRPREHEMSSWTVQPTSPVSSSGSSAHDSYLSSPGFSRASSASRTSYDSHDDRYFPSSNSDKKVSFSADTTVIPRRKNRESVGSSLYGPEDELPPPIEEDEEILLKMGVHRFSAAEYIREIGGTPMIIVDGKLYL